MWPKGITLAGALHTTPRPWDLKFFDFGEFPNPQKNFFLYNGKSSQALLALRKLDDSKLIRGGSLRFTHLENSHKYSSPSGYSPLGWKVLVFSRTNKHSAHEVASTSFSLQSLSDSRLSLSPPPSIEGWVSRNCVGEKIEFRGVGLSLDDYGPFITDSISSMNLKLAASGDSLRVYLPQTSLNFSPLVSLPNFTSYFHDDENY